MLKNIINKLKNSSEFTQENANIRLIGDRQSGKTSYMASLAYYPNASKDSFVQNIIPIGEDAENLITQAQNILEQGLELEPTMLNANIDEVKDYTLSITLANQVKLTINCKDYAGEFFSDLMFKIGEPLLDDYLDDCLQATGIILLIDGTSHRKDSEYAQGLDKFLLALNQADLGQEKRRIAVTFSKCEQSELWINRQFAEKIANNRFPQLSRRLQAWQNQNIGEVSYFTTSAFGVLGSQFPEPNSQKISRGREGTKSIIKNPRRWRPYGLVSPIYWLCTGKRNPKLEE
jgi:GTPase SAR1 family protein